MTMERWCEAGVVQRSIPSCSTISVCVSPQGRCHCLHRLSAAEGKEQRKW